jgi:uncharacterized membrane protein (TIGR02234 family)
MPERPGRRGSFVPTLAVGLATAALTLLAATRPWAEATTRAPALRTVTADGPDVAPLVLPLALVALAAWGTVLVLRRRGRRVVAALAVLAGLGAAAAAVLGVPDAARKAAVLLGAAGAPTHTTVWPFVAVAGGILTATAAVVAWLRAPGWPEMSGRYDAPTSQGTPAPDSGPRSGADLWRALDEGHDPTAD